MATEQPDYKKSSNDPYDLNSNRTRQPTPSEGNAGKFRDPSSLDENPPDTSNDSGEQSKP
jgi:hypothetical protein